MGPLTLGNLRSGGARAEPPEDAIQNATVAQASNPADLLGRSGAIDHSKSVRSKRAINAAAWEHT